MNYIKELYLSFFMIIIAFIVPLIVAGCASNNGGDTLESYNRSMYKINKSIDKYTIKPIAKAYRYVTPDLVENSVDNFFNNLLEVRTIVNSILQGKLKNAIASSARLVWNTTLGIGGLFDVATKMKIDVDKEDFGQTLQKWGISSGPYIVLPILGPSSITDSLGLFGDYFTSPINQYNNWSDHATHEGLVSLNIINERSKLLDSEKLLDIAKTDEYIFVKNLYLQRRATLVNDGHSESETEKETLDNLFND